MRRSMPMPMWMWALLLCVATGVEAQGPSTVILVRHAEKAAAPAADPMLTEAGLVRAAALRDALADAGVGAIISTPTARTRVTAFPLATALGIPVDTTALPRNIAAHAAEVAAAVRARTEQTVLVVGHSNTIPAILAALGGPRLPDLCDGEYDQLFIVRLRDGAAPNVIRARYGDPVTDTGCAPMRSGAGMSPPR
jgi:broad specificity phosphatase PhoE